MAGHCEPPGLDRQSSLAWPQMLGGAQPSSSASSSSASTPDPLRCARRGRGPTSRACSMVAGVISLPPNMRESSCTRASSATATPATAHDAKAREPVADAPGGQSRVQRVLGHAVRGSPERRPDAPRWLAAFDRWPLGSALQLNVHFLVLAPDGDGDGIGRFFADEPPSDARGRRPLGAPDRASATPTPTQFPLPARRAPLSAFIKGFSLHAATRVMASHRKGSDASAPTEPAVPSPGLACARSSSPHLRPYLSRAATVSSGAHDHPRAADRAPILPIRSSARWAGRRRRDS